VVKKITLTLFLALLLAGCQQTSTTNQASSVTSSPTDNSVQVEPTKANTDIFSSIQDAISKQLLLKCEFTDTDGQKTITYIKGQVVRMVGTGEESTVEGLMKDNKFYVWDSQKKAGMIIDLAQMTGDGGASMGGKQVRSIDDVVNVLQENKQNCSLSPESASLMELPTDVQFASTADFLK